MKTGVGLALIAVGAILAFAVDDEYPVFKPAHGRLGADHHRHHRDRRPAARLRLGRPARLHRQDPFPAGSAGRGGHLPTYVQPQPANTRVQAAWPRPARSAAPRRPTTSRELGHPRFRPRGAARRRDGVIEDVYDE